MRQCPDRYTIRAGQNLPDKEFRYLRTVIVTAAVYWGFNSKQSPGPIHCGSVSGAPLIPKLRGQFAEFLNYPSPVGLRILFLTTCVGLRYGRFVYTESFSRLHPCVLPYCNVRSLTPGSTNARVTHFKSVPFLKYFSGYGISTVCASATPFGLTLAPG